MPTLAFNTIFLKKITFLYNVMFSNYNDSMVNMLL